VTISGVELLVSTNNQSAVENNKHKSRRNRFGIELLALVVVVLATWLPRGFALDAFVTPDERLWVHRSAKFYYALATGDFAATYQTGHPAVTTMAAGTAGYLAIFPEFRGSGRGQVSGGEFSDYLRDEANISALELLQAGRFFMVLGNTIVLVIGYFYARKLLGLLPALVGFLLIAFEPFHLALSRLLHMDGLLGSLYLVSVLVFIYFLQKRRPFDLVLASVLTGLCWLTKSPGLLLGPVVGTLAVLESWRGYQANKRTPIRKQIWDFIWPLSAWFVIGALVFVVLWPAMWVDPIQSLTKIFSAANRVTDLGHFSGTFFNGVVAEKLGPASLYYYPLTYLWRTTPVVILGLALCLWGYFTNRKPLDQPEARLTFFGLALAVLIFTIGMTVGDKKVERYLLPVYAPLDLIAGIGWVYLVNWLKERDMASLSQYSTILVLVPVLGVQAFLSLRTFPYYYSYVNPAMGGSKKAPEVVQIGWGEGLDQAAAYLNQKPDAEKLNVLSWYSSGPFSYFFKGRALNLGFDPEFNEGEKRNLAMADYVVVYINQIQRNRPAELLDYLAQLEPEKTIWINGIEYVRIYRMP
jgi:hypothetical protein